MTAPSQIVITSPTAAAASTGGVLWGPEDFGVTSFDACDVAALTGAGDPTGPAIQDARERLGLDGDREALATA